MFFSSILNLIICGKCRIFLVFSFFFFGWDSNCILPSIWSVKRVFRYLRITNLYCGLGCACDFDVGFILLCAIIIDLEGLWGFLAFLRMPECFLQMPNSGCLGTECDNLNLNGKCSIVVQNWEVQTRGWSYSKRYINNLILLGWIRLIYDWYSNLLFNI